MERKVCLLPFSASLKKIQIYRKKAEYRLTVLFDEMRAEFIEHWSWWFIEHIVESGRIGLSGGIMKSAKVIGSSGPDYPWVWHMTWKSRARAQWLLLLKFARYSKMFGAKAPVKCAWNCIGFGFQKVGRVYGGGRRFRILTFLWDTLYITISI